MGALLSKGWRPRRTLLIYSLGGGALQRSAGSRYWAQRHAQILQTRVVAFLSLASSNSSDPGPSLSVYARTTPSLSAVGRAAAAHIQDPENRGKEEGNGAQSTVTEDNDLSSLLGTWLRFEQQQRHNASISMPELAALCYMLADIYAASMELGFGASAAEQNRVCSVRSVVTMAQLWGTVALDLADSPLLPLEYADFTSLLLQKVEAMQSHQLSISVKEKDANHFRESVEQTKKAIMEFIAATGNVQQEGAEVYSSLLKRIGSVSGSGDTADADSHEVHKEVAADYNSLQLRLRGVNDRLMLVERSLVMKVSFLLCNNARNSWILHASQAQNMNLQQGLAGIEGIREALMQATAFLLYP